MESGTRLGPYEICEPLGKGGMGEVWQALDTRLDREVAIKVLPEEFAADPERLARFEQEAKTLAGIDHPGIVTVYSIESTETGDARFITMQLIDGQPLDHAIPAEGCSIEKLCELAIPLAEAVGAAHQRGIVHRDLKPANVLVTADGRVKVLDFGLAKATAVFGGDDTDTKLATDVAPVTEAGQVVGTVAYMSPEQAEAQPVDERSDVFALGILLYEMATGGRPFTGETKMSVLSAIIRGEPVAVVELNPRLPRHLGRIIAKCLQKDPARRYQSALGVANDLMTLAEEVRTGEVAGVSAGPSIRERSAPGRGPKIVAFAAITALIALAGWVFLRPEGTTVVAGVSRQVTRAAGLEIDPALSPDGELVAYAAGPQAQMRLYVRSAVGGRSVPLTAELAGNHRVPRWAPDGSRIAFMTESALWTVPALGGVPRQVSTAIADGVNGLDWSPDGSRLVFATGSGSLSVVPVNGAEATVLAETGSSHSPRWSPDGRWIAYVEGNSDYQYTPNALGNVAAAAIWVVPAIGGAPVRVTDHPGLNISPGWQPDSKGLFFISDRDGTRDVYQVSIDESGTSTGRPVRLTTSLDAHSISVSGDGRQLVYSEFRYSTNVWTLPIPEAGSASVADATQTTRGDQVIEAMAVSPDRRWLAFDSNLGGNHDIYRMPIGGGEEEQLTTDPAIDFLTSYSPDGSEIGFYSMRTGARRIYTMSASGGPATQLTFGEGQHRYPTFSPDGLRLAYSNSDVTDAGDAGIGLVTRGGPGTPADSDTMITRDGGNRPRWSPDGAWIAYVINEGAGTRLMLVTPDGQDARELVRVEDREAMPAPEFPAWSADGQIVYYTAFDHLGNSSIWSVPVDGGEPTLRVRFDVPGRSAGRREFTTDGRSLYFTLGMRESDIWVMQLETR